MAEENMKNTESMMKFINLADLRVALEKEGYVVINVANDSLHPLKQLKESNPTKVTRVKMDADQLERAVEWCTRTFPPVEKRFCDPPVTNQSYCLISFNPAVGATPDKDDYFGFMKVRGVYATKEDAEFAAEEIVNNVDSLHPVYIGSVGAPMPLTTETNEKHVQVLNKLSFEEKVRTEIPDEIRRRRNAQSEQERELKSRTEKLKAENQAELRGDIDPEKAYFELRMNRANAIFSMSQLYAGIAKLKKTIIAAEENIKIADERNPDFRDKFIDKYNKTVAEIGLDEKDAMIRYLVGKIPFDLDCISDTLVVLPSDEPPIVGVDLSKIDPFKVAVELAKNQDAVSGGSLGVPSVETPSSEVPSVETPSSETVTRVTQ